MLSKACIPLFLVVLNIVCSTSQQKTNTTVLQESISKLNESNSSGNVSNNNSKESSGDFNNNNRSNSNSDESNSSDKVSNNNSKESSGDFKNNNRSNSNSDESNSSGKVSNNDSSNSNVKNDSRNSTDICPKPCNCYYSNNRNGIIVDCANRQLSAVPDLIPNGTIYVNLRQNSIQNLTPDSFKNWFTKLIQKLNLAQNKISSIHPDAFQNFNHMWEINLSRNNISFIDNVKLPVVHELNLEGNPLKLGYKFEQNGYKKYEIVGLGDCETIYKRVTTSSNEAFVKHFVNVDMIMMKSKCTEPLTQDDNLTASILQPYDDNETVQIVFTTAETEEFPLPTAAEKVFYCSLLVIFFGLVLFLISQSYNHVWTKCFRKKSVSRRHTSPRKTTVNIHAEPHRSSANRNAGDSV